jgi:hypothetical protein
MQIVIAPTAAFPYETVMAKGLQQIQDSRYRQYWVDAYHCVVCCQHNVEGVRRWLK